MRALTDASRVMAGGMIGRRTDNMPVHPVRLWYLVASGLLAAAMTCIVLAVMGVISVDRQTAGYQRLSVPGATEVTFARPGRYVLYIEMPGQCCTFSYGGGSEAPFAGFEMRVLLAPIDGGPRVPLHVWQGEPESYDVAGHQGMTACSAARST